MAASPSWKVYTAAGEYIAAVKLPEYGAMILAGLGQDGATLRFGHGRGGIYWTEGSESFPANESYDGVAETVWKRRNAVST